jgi:hypothetical protein
MLKVTSVNSRAPWTIKVEGQLFTPWVPELQSVFARTSALFLVHIMQTGVPFNRLRSYFKDQR